MTPDNSDDENRASGGTAHPPKPWEKIIISSRMVSDADYIALEEARKKAADLLAEKNFKAARRVYEDYINTHQKPVFSYKTCVAYGRALVETGEHEAALKLVNEYIISPDKPAYKRAGLHIVYTLALEKAKRYPEILEHFKALDGHRGFRRKGHYEGNLLELSGIRRRAQEQVESRTPSRPAGPQPASQHDEPEPEG